MRYNRAMKLRMGISQPPSLEGGAGGRNRTDTRLPSQDFESCASTNFTTPALWIFTLVGPGIYHKLRIK